MPTQDAIGRPVANNALCSFAPPFEGTATTDGIGDDFCSIPAQLFVASKGAAPTSEEGTNTVPSGITGQPRIRSHGRETVLLVFVHVDKSPTYSAPPGQLPFSTTPSSCSRQARTPDTHCATTFVAPYCDDRAWCGPMLE